MCERIPRKLKKILRNIHLCHGGNPFEKHSKYSKEKWVRFTKIYEVWIRVTIANNEVMIEARLANEVRKTKNEFLRSPFKARYKTKQKDW